MRVRGLEPPRDKLPSGPQPDASANSATPASSNKNIQALARLSRGEFKKTEKKSASIPSHKKSYVAKLFQNELSVPEESVPNQAQDKNARL